DAVTAAALEIPGSEAQRDAAPVVRAATEHARAKPHEAIACGDGVGLAFDVPATDAAVELAERPLARAGAAARRIVVPGKHLAVFFRRPGRARLEQHALGSGLSQDLGR